MKTQPGIELIAGFFGYYGARFFLGVALLPFLGFGKKTPLYWFIPLVLGACGWLLVRKRNPSALSGILAAAALELGIVALYMLS